jgi:DNA (cytosine-5)-methyltransferase 1
VTRRPRVLDLFGGEGLAALGWALAGFDVLSVENDPERIANHIQLPNVEVFQADATTFPFHGFDVVGGSPPCTGWTTQKGVADRARGTTAGTEWMLPHTIERMQRWGEATGGVWVVENVTGARKALPGPWKLCGSMFGLTDGGWLMRRHRWFASNMPVQVDMPCRCHGERVIGVYGDLTPNDRRCAGRRQNRPNGDMRAGVERARRLMGGEYVEYIAGVSPQGLTFGVPPHYTRWVGEQAMNVLTARVSGLSRPWGVRDSATEGVHAQ